LALTAAVFVIVFAQLLAVSRFDAVTVRAVLTSAGPTQVVLGTVVNSLPFMLVLVAIAVPTLLRMRGRVTGQYAHVFWALAFAASVTVIYFAVFLGLYSLPWVSFGILLGNAPVPRTDHRVGPSPVVAMPLPHQGHLVSGHRTHPSH
jgi:hypothetical protein